MKKLLTIWKNKWKIVEGIRYTWFPNKYVEAIAQKRVAICKTNQCGHYEEKGVSDICVKKGSGCCNLCGCNDFYKGRSLSSACSLKEQGKYPLWDVEMTEEEEKKFREKTGIKNE